MSNENPKIVSDAEGLMREGWEAAEEELRKAHILDLPHVSAQGLSEIIEYLKIGWHDHLDKWRERNEIE